ncbi:YbdD/YjiX family protein [Yersinia sp. J1]|uniref:YbdD/YjiX family protein n=1 Tax=Yersinia sp. J1 TaxID=3424774 RepID=UPI003D36A878
MVNSGLIFQHKSAAARSGLHILRCVPLAPLMPQPKSLWGKMRLIAKRTAQSFRLMVGVQDYGNYLQHMRRHHPEKMPMTEREFHRYCLDARFPSQGGKLGKCPC